MDFSKLEWPEGPGRRWLWRGLITLIVLACLILSVDFLRFVGSCGGYARLTDRPQLPEGDKTHEAIVVLTGDHSRISRAIELMRLRGSRWLIISGAAKGITLTDLVNRQGPSAINIHEIWQKIIVESESSSTVENAIESQKILREKGMTRAILVTSDYHMDRSLAAFRAVDKRLQYIPFPVRSDFFQEALFDSPQRTMNGMGKVIFEYLKTIAFHVSTNQK